MRNSKSTLLTFLQLLCFLNLFIFTTPISGQFVQLGNDVDGVSAGNSFGWTVSMSSDGNRMAIGAYGSGAGYTQVFEWDGVVLESAR